MEKAKFDEMHLVSTIITILMIIVMIYGFISAIMETEKYYYECIDMQGERVICDRVSVCRNQMLGYKSDGTVLTITSYKRIER